jgi:riboflavin kinase/FMN adenylyltransferase
MRNAARRGLAVGFFDGVHLGHRAILEGASAALTFANHPLSTVAPERAPRLIMSAEDRVAAMRGCGVGKVTVLDFTRELAGMSAEDFARTYLSDLAEDRVVRCGDNWRFGRGGAGDASLLESMGFTVEVVPYATYDGGRISSTRVRAAIESGDVEAANAMLGREWSVRGRTFRGKGVGAELGYPTVNLRLHGVGLDLLRGVYAVAVDGSRAIANYGVAPTFGDRAWADPALELHFTDPMPESALRDELSVSFRRFVRPERKFSSKEELAAQIRADLASVRA